MGLGLRGRRGGGDEEGRRVEVSFLQSPWTCFVRFDSVRLQFFTRYIKLYLTSWYTLSSALH